MPEYTVLIDNEETNEVAKLTSITGRVNATECAVVIHMSKLDGKTPAEAKRIKQLALIEAFQKRQSVPLAGGETITL